MALAAAVEAAVAKKKMSDPAYASAQKVKAEIKELTAARAALAEANEARAAAASVERSMLTAQEYRLSEEAGYQMQTIIQMAPSRATVTSVYEQPQTIDTYVPM